MCREKTTWDKKELVSCGARSQERPILPEPRFWIFSFQSCEKLNFCGLNQQVNGMLLQQSEQSPPLYCPGTLLPESRIKAGVSVTLPYTTSRCDFCSVQGATCWEMLSWESARGSWHPEGQHDGVTMPIVLDGAIFRNVFTMKSSCRETAGGCGCGRPSDRLQERAAYVTHAPGGFKYSKELVFRKLGFMHWQFGEMSRKN